MARNQPLPRPKSHRAKSQPDFHRARQTRSVGDPVDPEELTQRLELWLLEEKTRKKYNIPQLAKRVHTPSSASPASVKSNRSTSASSISPPVRVKQRPLSFHQDKLARSLQFHKLQREQDLVKEQQQPLRAALPPFVQLEPPPTRAGAVHNATGVSRLMPEPKGPHEPTRSKSRQERPKSVAYVPRYADRSMILTATPNLVKRESLYAPSKQVYDVYNNSFVPAIKSQAPTGASIAEPSTSASWNTTYMETSKSKEIGSAKDTFSSSSRHPSGKSVSEKSLEVSPQSASWATMNPTNVVKAHNEKRDKTTHRNGYQDTNAILDVVHFDHRRVVPTKHFVFPHEQDQNIDPSSPHVASQQNPTTVRDLVVNGDAPARTVDECIKRAKEIPAIFIPGERRPMVGDWAQEDNEDEKKEGFIERMSRKVSRKISRNWATGDGEDQEKGRTAREELGKAMKKEEMGHEQPTMQQNAVDASRKAKGVRKDWEQLPSQRRSLLLATQAQLGPTLFLERQPLQREQEEEQEQEQEREQEQEQVQMQEQVQVQERVQKPVQDQEQDREHQPEHEYEHEQEPAQHEPQKSYQELSPASSQSEQLPPKLDPALPPTPPPESNHPATAEPQHQFEISQNHFHNQSQQAPEFQQDAPISHFKISRSLTEPIQFCPQCSNIATLPSQRNLSLRSDITQNLRQLMEETTPEVEEWPKLKSFRDRHRLLFSTLQQQATPEAPQKRPKSRGTGRKEILKSLLDPANQDKIADSSRPRPKSSRERRKSFFGSFHSADSPSQTQNNDRPWSRNDSLKQERKSPNAAPNEKEVEVYIPTNPNRAALNHSPQQQWQRNSIVHPSHDRNPSISTASSTLSHTDDYMDTLSFPRPRSHPEGRPTQFVPDLAESEVDSDVVPRRRMGQTVPTTPGDMTPVLMETERRRKSMVSSRRLSIAGRRMSRFVEMGSMFGGKEKSGEMVQEGLDWDGMDEETGFEEGLTLGKGRERLRLGVRKGLVSILDLTDKKGDERDSVEKKKGKGNRWWKVWPHGRRGGK